MLAIILITPFLVFSQSIAGKIKRSGKQVSCSEIIAVRGHFKQTAISGEKGNFVLKLPENGAYQIVCILDGIEVLKDDITVNVSTGSDQSIFESLLPIDL